MHVSVTKEQYVTVLDDKGSLRQFSVVEAQGRRKVVDWYGAVHAVDIVKASEKEEAYVVASINGEPAIFGETSTLLSRKPNEGRWIRRPIRDISEPLYLQLPQRKIRALPGLFDVLNIDDQGIFLEPPKASEMLGLMRKASWCGILVSRRKTELRVDLDRRRPACFATKLITGGFDFSLEKTLGNLVGSGIVLPSRFFDDAYLNEVQTKGALFEGGNVMNNVPVLSPKRLEKTVDVYHIKPEQPSTPIELTWFHA